jgi:hypothetical protein
VVDSTGGRGGSLFPKGHQFDAFLTVFILDTGGCHCCVLIFDAEPLRKYIDVWGIRLVAEESYALPLVDHLDEGCFLSSYISALQLKDSRRIAPGALDASTWHHLVEVALNTKK